VLQGVLYTTEKGAHLPLRQFRSSNTGRKLLDGLRQTALTTCVNLDSWKPLGYDFGNAKARRFLPSSELLLANSSLEVVDNIADYFAGRFAMREIRCSSSVELAPESGVSISPSVVARLEHGTGFRFNLSKACPIIDRLSEEKHVRVLRDGQRAIGCLRSTEAMHTRWSQKPCGRIYAADPAITNIPRILRPALEPINGKLVGEIDYQNFKLRLAHAEAGLTVPPGDYARRLGEKTGLSREAVKAVLNPALHGQTQGNLVGMKKWDELHNRKVVQEFLEAETPELWHRITSLAEEPDLLQRRGARVFFAALEAAFDVEDIPAGIPIHDGWLFPAQNKAQVVRIKQIFQDVGTQLLGQTMPAKDMIWNQ
jgi:hypothetical protein